VVYQDALKATQITPEMEHLKNLYENLLLQEYTKENYDPKKIEGLTQEYMNIRMKDCSLKADFAKGLNTPHQHIYIKTLRERVMDELKLDEGTSMDDMNYMNMFDLYTSKELKPESKYDLNHLNSDKAIGYQNLLERARDPENEKEIAHTNVFDEMLADYFLQKRGDYKKSNKLMSDLETAFDAQIDPNTGHPSSTVGNTLGFHYMNQSVGKDEAIELIPYNFPALMDLDVAVNRQLHNNRGGFSKELKALADEDVSIPDHFPLYDVRKPADLYVNDKLEDILDELFEARGKLEKHLSRSELVAYDKVLAKYLTFDNLLGKLKREIYKDYNELEQMNQMANHAKDSVRSENKQRMKKRNNQPEFNKGVVNEDAFYKHLAYTGLLEKKRRDNHKATLADPVLEAGFHSFENYY
jgi:hypothetical protein